MSQYDNQSNVGMSAGNLQRVGAGLISKNGTSPLEQAIDRLGAVNSQLSEEIKALQDKLSPVLVKIPPSVANAAPQPQAPLTGTSEVVERLCHRADQIYSAILAIREIKERLEV